MKKLQRIWIILLILSFILSINPPAYAAKGQGISLNMTASASNPKVGEVIDITIGTDRDFASRGSGMTISYDPAVLQPVLEYSTMALPFEIHGPMVLDGKTVLRISFLPGLKGHEISATNPLAVVKFRALAETVESLVTLEAAYFYDGSLAEIPAQMPEAVTISVQAGGVYIPVSGITLDQTSLTVEEGEMASLKANVAPVDASNNGVVWTSSDERVAMVSGGAVKGIAPGSANITAKTVDGGFEAFCTVTVIPQISGYTVKMPGDTKVVIGELVQIPVMIGNEDAKTGYNAFDISFTYDPEVLELVTQAVANMTLDTEPGKINILTYGEDRSVGTIPFTLEFRALKTAVTEVVITDARVDQAENAVMKNAPQAVCLDDRTQIDVTGYPVSLPDGFQGEEFAKPGTDYIFVAPDDGYEYSVTVTVDGVEIDVTVNPDGTYTIPGGILNGSVVVTVNKVGKVFGVTLGEGMTGPSTAQCGVDYTATLNKEEGYQYVVTVSIGGKGYTGYTVSGDTYTIPGDDITGEILFVVTKTEIIPPSHGISFTGDGAGAAVGNPVEVSHGGDYRMILVQESGYIYEVSYTMGGQPGGVLTPGEDGSYVVKNVTADLEITITKTLDLKLSIYEYLNLDQKTVFLVLVETKLDAGKHFTFGDSPMYYSEGYQAWAYLVIREAAFHEEDAASLIDVTKGEHQVLEMPNCDVNGTGLVDINDAQLVYNLYNGKYEDFTRISMVKFLNADVNLDHRLSVMDAAGVMIRIE